MEKNETCSAAFFSSVKADKVRKMITGVRDSRGQVVTEAGEVGRVVTDHFRSFFCERVVDEDRAEAFLQLVAQRVSPDLAEVLEAPLSLGELEGALRRMGKRKVPGIDGLPAEFYLRFWGILGPVVLEVLTEVLRTGTLGGSMAVGVVSLLYKRGTPPTFVTGGL